MDSILQQVEDFARIAHGEQRRKYADEPYIQHPIRVMKTCRQYTGSIPVLAAALLHDVLEDTKVSKQELADFLDSVMDHRQSGQTLQLVIELTDIFTSAKYPQFNRNKRKRMENDRLAKASPSAHTIKYADIIDNSTDILHADTDFKMKYLQECLELLVKIPRGDPALYQKALATVKDCIKYA